MSLKIDSTKVLSVRCFFSENKISVISSAFNIKTLNFLRFISIKKLHFYKSKMADNDPIYTQACSEKTVQSDSEGFFAEFYSEVLKTAGEKWLKGHFKNLKSDEDRILALFHDPQICDPVIGILEHVQPVFKEKDAAFSSQRRIQGEKFLLMEDSTKALAMLNQAVVRAPAKGVDRSIDRGFTLAMAYWSRSAILLSVKEGLYALQDLKLAAKNGFDAKQNVDYYWRMTKAYAIMGDAIKTKITMGILEKLLETEKHRIEKYRQELSEIAPVKTKLRTEAPLLTGGENPKLKSASNLLQLEESLDKGRYIAAKDNIKAGDVILVENPVAACLLSKLFGSNCMHCYKKLVIPIGCPNCSGIAFCSEDCMNAAYNSYHKYECKFLDLLVGSGMSILCFIALRVFTQAANVDEGLATATDLITNLCGHKESRAPKDFLQRTLMATFLLRCLQKAEYFGRRTTEAVDPTGKELDVAVALLGLLQILQFNAHEIHQKVITGNHKFDNSKISYVGAAIYKTGSYFNHDCCPGVARIFVDKSIVLICTRPVKPGQPVSENYGPIVTKIPMKERRRILRSRYWFDCNCDACRENWPVLDKLDVSIRYKCPIESCPNILKSPKDVGKDVRCNSCRKNVSLKESYEVIKKVDLFYRKAALYMSEEKTEDAINAFKEGISLFHEVAVLPHKATLIAQESLRTCYFDTGTKFTYNA